MMSWITSSLLLTWRIFQTIDISRILNSLSRRWASLANLASDAVVVVVVEMMSWITSSLLLTWRFLQSFDISQNIWILYQEIVHRWLTWHQMQWWWWWWRWRWCPELQAVCCLLGGFSRLSTSLEFLNSLSRRWASLAKLASDAVVVVVMMSWITSSPLLTWSILQTFDISRIFEFSLRKSCIVG